MTEAFGFPEVSKSYPPEVEIARQSWLEVLNDSKRKYEEKLNPPVTGTALSMARAPRTQHELAELDRAYRDECEPIIRQLARLEGFATVSMVIPSDQLAPDVRPIR